MRITINIPRRVAYFNGAAHDLTRAGCNRVFVWLQDNAKLLWGWVAEGEYVFEVNHATN